MEQSATLLRLAVAQRRGEEWPALKKKMGSLQVCPDPRLLSWGNWRLPKGVGVGGVILYDWLGLLIWRSLIGPALETGPKIRDADHSGLLAAVVVVWLPQGCLQHVVGQSSTVI